MLKHLCFVSKKNEVITKKATTIINPQKFIGDINTLSSHQQKFNMYQL